FESMRQDAPPMAPTRSRAAPDRAWDALLLGSWFGDPGEEEDVQQYDALGRLFRSSLTPSQKMELLGRREGSDDVVIRAFRLVNQIVLGRRLGVDVSEAEDELAGLRALHDQQP